MLRLTLPLSARRPGTYTIVFTAHTPGQTAKQTIKVRVEPTVKLAANRATQARTVILAAPAGSAIASQLHGLVTSVVSGGADDTFRAAANPRRDVVVLVRDADQIGISTIRDLPRDLPQTCACVASRAIRPFSRASCPPARPSHSPSGTSASQVAKMVARLAAARSAPAPGFQSGSSPAAFATPREDEEEVGEPVPGTRARPGSHRSPAGREAPRARPGGTPSARRGAQRRRRTPGRTKLFSSGRSALNPSQSSSSAATCSGVTRRRSGVPDGTERSAPRSKSSSGSGAAALPTAPGSRQRGRRRAVSSARRRHPRPRSADRASTRASRRRGASRPRRPRGCRSASAERLVALARAHRAAWAASARAKSSRAITIRCTSLVPS